MIKAFNGKTPQIDDSACISNSAYIVGDVVIGENSTVWPGAVIRGDVGRIVIGSNTHVEDNCVVHGGNTQIGNNVIVGHGAVIHSCAIGNDVLIGMNATILHKAEIDSHVVIGAHALIEKETHVPTESLVVGAPATIKKLTERSKPWAYRGNTGVYTNLAREYMKNGF
ncbi:MAG: gamma carbonic anhydrase family protein [Chloroflexi bacterium]|jgi:carbonic anhydrase/acetyltransferase-like protein (isoleucine patch superfamily)|nr:gamma carbonic anhydrase family protein [Chloroflexota bacterium]MBT7080086.1 gamma carbonic anhydrase family protein [Chloroflexota bacterium]MBT7290476.1 gamma carbonic anhydrase family protein [Chloroflexota bacterium]